MTEASPPTSASTPPPDSLHVGSLLVVLMLRRLQEAGHRPIALVGGGTGAIGDPGGKTEERALLTRDELARNLAGMHAQLERLIDFTGDGGASRATNFDTRATLLDNGEWLSTLTVVEFLRDVGKHFSVNQMMGREAVRTRLERPDQGISFTEFSYMLLQAYDYLHLFDAEGCRLQLGASDQWGNITMGIELIRKARRQEVYGLTTPLVLKADGTKFGKTETGTVWLDASRTSPYQLYQYFYRSEDSVVGTYLRCSRSSTTTTIRALDVETTEHPDASRPAALAREVCTLVHGADEARRAESAATGALLRRARHLDQQRCWRCAPRRPPRPARGPRSTERGWRWSTHWWTRGWRSQRARLARWSTRVRCRSTTVGRQDVEARFGREDLSSTATSSCARAATTISCASNEGAGMVVPAPGRERPVAGPRRSASSGSVAARPDDGTRDDAEPDEIEERFVTTQDPAVVGQHASSPSPPPSNSPSTTVRAHPGVVFRPGRPLHGRCAWHRRLVQVSGRGRGGPVHQAARRTVAAMPWTAWSRTPVSWGPTPSSGCASTPRRSATR